MGFKRLILQGKLLDIPAELVDAAYDMIDCDASGAITFLDIWPWFIHQAREYNARFPKKPLVFTLTTLLSARERSLMILRNRFALQKTKNFTSYDASEFKDSFSNKS